MYWNSHRGQTIYTVKPIITSSSITKRIIFSKVAKIFDPLGLLNPVIVTVKLLMQELWKLKLDWDESLPLDITTQWSTFVSQLSTLNDISFERKMLHDQPVNVQLHGFCDASERAYGACIYLRSTDLSGCVRVRLFCAKSRVAPIKPLQTIPRLELCAAVLLANLYATVTKANFVGANNELKELQTLLNDQQHNDKVHGYLAEKGIAWHFIPPQSPHVGGIWEAAVKSFKHHLKRVVGSELFTFEQLSTLTTEIEAVLNSRPLTALSFDPNDLTALTLSHFLVSHLLTSLPQHDLSATPTNRLSTWQHIQKVKQDFWTRWHKEYINELNIRRKWTRGEHPIIKGSIVIIRDDNAPPLQWRLGRVIETHPGPDGVIRTVRVKTSTGMLDRNVKRLAPLPVNSETNN